MEKVQIIISEVADEAWKFTKKHGLMIAVFFLIYSMVSYAITFAFLPKGYFAAVSSGDAQKIQLLANQVSPVSSLITLVLGILFAAGMTNLMIKLASGQMDSVSLDAFKMPAMTYVKYYAVYIVSVLGVCIGMLCCFLPGIYLAARLGVARYYIIENPDADVLDAVKASWKMTDKNVLAIIGLVLVSLVAVCAGFMACCVGVFYAEAFIEALFVVAYMQLKPNLNC